MLFTVQCEMCREWYNLGEYATEEQFERWISGDLVQDAFPDMPADLRELLISGFCGKCFEAMVPKE